MTTTAALHSLFQELTSNKRRWDTGLDMTWAHWIRAGFTENHLELVVKYIKAHLHPKGYFHPASLGFRRLIADPENFADRLMEAEQWERANKARKRRPEFNPGKAAVLRAAGMPDEPAQQDAKRMTEPEINAMWQNIRKGAGL